MVPVMAEEPTGQQPRSDWRMVAVLAALIALTGTAGAVVAAFQRPPTSSPRGPTPFSTPLPFPRVSPTPVPGVPILGFGFSVADDPATRRVIVFGGVDSYATTWLWDGTRWSLAQPLISPPGRFLAAAAYDPSTRLVMLFGGRLAPGQLVNDTWGWDGTSWRELNTGANGPPGGEAALMAWDDSTREMVLVTPAETTTVSQTWVWVGSHWVARPSGNLPVGVFARGMSFDPVSRALLFVGTQSPNGAGDSTWRWDGASWRELRASTPTIPTGVALDPSSGRLLLCGTIPGAPSSQLWSWGGRTWIPVPASFLPIGAEAEIGDVDHRQFLIFGFSNQSTQGSPQPVQVWRWSGHAWLQLDAGAGG